MIFGNKKEDCWVSSLHFLNVAFNVQAMFKNKCGIYMWAESQVGCEFLCDLFMYLFRWWHVCLRHGLSESWEILPLVFSYPGQVGGRLHAPWDQKWSPTPTKNNNDMIEASIISLLCHLPPDFLQGRKKL